MQRKKSSARSRRTGASRSPARLSLRTRKQIDTLPIHARHIYQMAHKNALKQYKSPSKRRGGKRQSRELNCIRIDSPHIIVKVDEQRRRSVWITLARVRNSYYIRVAKELGVDKIVVLSLYYVSVLVPTQCLLQAERLFR